MTSRYQESMGAKLRAIRSKRDVEAGDCARFAGTSVRNWYRWERAVPVKRIQRAYSALRAAESDTRGHEGPVMTQGHMDF